MKHNTLKKVLSLLLVICMIAPYLNYTVVRSAELCNGSAESG